MEPFQVELDDIVNSMAGQIANQARAIAMLEGQVAALTRALEPQAGEVPVDDGEDAPE
jgi:hypothetical protein